MNIGEKIKALREKKGLLQKKVAEEIGMHPSNYSKVEKGERELSLDSAAKVAQLFGLSVDQLIHLQEDDSIKEVKVENKGVMEQVLLIQELEDKDQEIIFRMINTLLTKKKFKDFFEQQLAS